MLQCRGRVKKNVLPSPDLRFDPDAPAVHFHDFLDQRQADAGAFHPVARSERLEQLEDFFEMALLNARAVVGDAEFPLLALGATGDADFALGFIHVFDGVGEQILEHLLDAGRLCHDGRQGIFDADRNICRRGKQVDHLPRPVG